MTGTIEIKVGYNEQSKGWVGETSIKLTGQIEELHEVDKLKNKVRKFVDDLTDDVQQNSTRLTLRKGGI